MNILYQSLFPASIMPWVIIFLHYITNGHYTLSFILASHLVTQVIVILHRPVRFDIVTWHRALHLQRLGLWSSYAVNNQSSSTILALVVYIFVSSRMNLYKTMKTNTVHTTIVLMFCSTATVFQTVIAIACGGLFCLVNKPLAVQWEDKTNIEKYFQSRILYNYLFALVAWSTGPMKSILFVIIGIVLFNVVVISTVKDRSKEEEWYEPRNLPEDYPYPLNIKEAVQTCNMAKKLFKSHSI
mgnify:CR=1 FL=1|jgi:hypothetical protein